MGVNLAIYKSMAFAYSAALMGLAGALFAHKIAYLGADIFTILLSIQFLLLVNRGGLGSLPARCSARSSGPFCRRSSPSCAIRFRRAWPRLRRPPALPRSAPGEAVGNFLRKPGVEAGHLRPDPGAGHPARAARHVRRWVKIRIFF